MRLSARIRQTSLSVMLRLEIRDLGSFISLWLDRNDIGLAVRLNVIDSLVR